jgi:hypothetical protein
LDPVPSEVGPTLSALAGGRSRARRSCRPFQADPGRKLERLRGSRQA